MTRTELAQWANQINDMTGVSGDRLQGFNDRELEALFLENEGHPANSRQTIMWLAMDAGYCY